MIRWWNSEKNSCYLLCYSLCRKKMFFQRFRNWQVVNWLTINIQLLWIKRYLSSKNRSKSSIIELRSFHQYLYQKIPLHYAFYAHLMVQQTNSVIIYFSHNSINDSIPYEIIIIIYSRKKILKCHCTRNFTFEVALLTMYQFFVFVLKRFTETSDINIWTTNIN